MRVCAPAVRTAFPNLSLSFSPGLGLTRARHIPISPRSTNVAREQHDLEGPEAAGPREIAEAEDLDDLDDVEVVDARKEEEETEEPAAVLDVDEGSEQASLEELLAQRAASKRAAEDPEEDADIMSLSSEARTPVLLERPLASVTPVRDRHEFVCKSCHLVKPRVQLADERRGFCRDCV